MLESYKFQDLKELGVSYALAKESQRKDFNQQENTLRANTLMQALQNTQLRQNEFVDEFVDFLEEFEEFSESMEKSEYKHTKTPNSPNSHSNNKEVKEAATIQPLQVVKTQNQHTSFRGAVANEFVRHFASSFKEEIQNYKPPISKITLELNPKNLGTLELVISKNGSDLIVQVSSNQTALAIFMQNQEPLRSNLQQIGFENVELSFSQSNQQQDRQQEHSHFVRNENSLEDLQENEEIPTMMEIRIPKYA